MRVTSKGQVTIPKYLRRRQNIRAGTDVNFVEEKDGRIVLLKTAGQHAGGARRDNFEEYLDRVTGIVDIGMPTDEFMQLLRGE